MKEKLASFLAHGNVLPQEWGKLDCCLVLADWAMWLGQRDPAQALRGAYQDEEGCRAIVRAAGGLIPLVQRCADLSGWTRMEAPVVGCIGVIGSAQVVNRQFGAIYDGQYWLVRLKDGFVHLTARPLVVWGLECQ